MDQSFTERDQKFVRGSEGRMKALLTVACPSILLLAERHVGNNLFLTPAIHLLKRICPTLTLDIVVTSQRGAGVFEDNPDIRTVHTVCCRMQLRRLVKTYSAVISFKRDGATRKWLRGMQVPSWIIDTGRPDLHRADEALEFMRDLLDCEIAEEDRRYVLCPQPRNAARIAMLLQNVRPEKRLIGFHLGNRRTSIHGWKFWWRGRERDARLWPPENYIALGRLMSRFDPTLTIVLTGSRNERFLGRRFVREVPNAINLMGATSLLDLAALMPRLHTFVTQDTGALHIACSSNVPLVGLFGLTNPVLTGPYPLRPWHTIIKKEKTTDISPDEVAAAVLNTMRNSAP